MNLVCQVVQAVELVQLYIHARVRVVHGVVAVAFGTPSRGQCGAVPNRQHQQHIGASLSINETEASR